MTTTTPRDRIFISYRRDDAAEAVVALKASLVDTFGEDRVFHDVDMAGGADFPPRLLAELDRAAVLLVVINDGWLAAADEDHRRRIDDPTDWVRREIVYGLDNALLVVPVLINDAKLPSAKALPTELAELSRRQWRRLQTDHWTDSLQPLIRDIAAYTGWPLAGDSPDTGSVGLAERIFGSRPPVVHDFVGRSQLKELGGPGRRVVSALHGIGGVGKSQLAARYFRDHHAEFDYAAWIDMRDQDGFTDYNTIASAFDLDVSGGDVATVVRSAIQGSPATWLLVFDNADRPEQVVPLLPDGDQAKIIITSRYRNWNRFAEVVNVDVFDPETAVTYLARQADRPNDPDAERLAQALGYLPLALSLAGALCREQAISFSQFLEQRLPQGLTESLNPDQPTTYDRAIAALWEESAKALNDQAVNLAQLLSLLDWTSIDRAWLRSTRFGQSVALDQRLAELASYSLVELTENTVAIKHNLIATGLAERTQPEQVESTLPALFDATPPPAPTAETAAAWAEPLRHLRRLLNDHPNLIPDDLIGTYQQAADQLNEEGHVVSDFHEAFHELCINKFGTDDQHTHRAAAALGFSYWVAGRTDEAISIEEQVLADRERLLGPEHPDTLTSRSNLALSYWQAGRTDEAITIGEQVLADSERLLGPEHPDTLKSRANLALSYSQAGRTDKAITIEEQVLADSERLLGPEHPDTLRSRANLAFSYRQAGRTDEAITIEEQVLADRERLLGPEHPDTLTIRANLAFSYWQAGRTDEAITIEEQVLADRERLLGPEHPDTLTIRANLAASYWQAGRTDEAITIFEQVLADRVRLLGPEHPDTLTSRANLAFSYRQAGRHEDADNLEAKDADT